MTEFKADLHCHTTASDGTTSPRDIVRLAKEIGLKGLSITDHDSIGAYDEAISEAKKEGIILGSGVEFSCFHNGKSVHVLGYDFDIHSSAIASYCESHKERRRDRNRRIMDLLEFKRMPIDRDKIDAIERAGKTAGRPHIAEEMIKRGYAHSIQDAFNRFLGEGRPCYASGPIFGIEDAMSHIRKGGGKVFLAHPHFMKDRGLLKQLLELPFDGIECYYAKCYPSIEAIWVEEAKKREWLMSGGSDYHGDVKQHINLGCSYVNEEMFNKIFENPLT